MCHDQTVLLRSADDASCASDELEHWKSSAEGDEGRADELKVDEGISEHGRNRRRRYISFRGPHHTLGGAIGPSPPHGHHSSRAPDGHLLLLPLQPPLTVRPWPVVADKASCLPSPLCQPPPRRTIIPAASSVRVRWLAVELLIERTRRGTATASFLKAAGVTRGGRLPAPLPARFGGPPAL